MATSPFLWNRLARGYAKSPVADEAAYQRKLEMTRAHFMPDSEVMEFGCGTGTTAVSHAPFVRHIHGYDISKNMLEIARERARKAVLAKVHRLLKPGGVFVSSTMCLGEMSGTLKAMAAVMRALPVVPPVQALTRDGLRREIRGAGFAIDKDWAPDAKSALFLVARRAAAS